MKSECVVSLIAIPYRKFHSDNAQIVDWLGPSKHCNSIRKIWTFFRSMGEFFLV